MLPSYSGIILANGVDRNANQKLIMARAKYDMIAVFATTVASLFAVRSIVVSFSIWLEGELLS